MRILALFLPCCLNILSSLVFFISTSRIQQESNNPVLATSALAVWAVLYTITSFVLSRFQNMKNAVWIIEISLALLVLDMFALTVFSSLNMQFIWLIISGVCCAGFFAPFQLFFKQINIAEQDPSVGHQTSLYLFAWSFGFASGNLLAAWLWGVIDPENGWRICYIISALLMIFVLGSVEICRRYTGRKSAVILYDENKKSGEQSILSSRDIAVEENCEKQYAVPPKLMNVMFLLGVAGCLTVAVIRSPLTLHLEAHKLSLVARSGILAL